MRDHTAASELGRHDADGRAMLHATIFPLHQMQQDAGSVSHRIPDRQIQQSHWLLLDCALESRSSCCLCMMCRLSGSSVNKGDAPAPGAETEDPPEGAAQACQLDHISEASTALSDEEGDQAQHDNSETNAGDHPVELEEHLSASTVSSPAPGWAFMAPKCNVPHTATCAAAPKYAVSSAFIHAKGRLCPFGSSRVKFS